MILEVQKMPLGFGVRTQRWAKTRHLIVHVGTVESRVIIPHTEPRRRFASFCLLMSGLVLIK